MIVFVVGWPHIMFPMLAVNEKRKKEKYLKRILLVLALFDTFFIGGKHVVVSCSIIFI